MPVDDAPERGGVSSVPIPMAMIFPEVERRDEVVLVRPVPKLIPDGSDLSRERERTLQRFVVRTLRRRVLGGGRDSPHDMILPT